MILDTCALLWLAEGGRRFSRSTYKQMAEAPVLFVSAISGFEIGRKVYRGVLDLPVPVAEWFARVMNQHGLTELPLDVTTCLISAGLPPIHEDPCDRFIIAAAKMHDCVVVTSDNRFPQYGIHTII